jgi:predicted transcriptional regulator
MAEPICQPELTRDEQALIALLRQSPQSVAGLAEALQTSAGQMEDALQTLARKVGLVPLFRYDTLRYGLAE